jgi:hypothetical protein
MPAQPKIQKRNWVPQVSLLRPGIPLKLIAAFVSSIAGRQTGGGLGTNKCSVPHVRAFFSGANMGNHRSRTNEIHSPRVAKTRRSTKEIDAATPKQTSFRPQNAPYLPHFHGSCVIEITGTCPFLRL